MKVCLANDSFPPLIDGVSNAVMNYASIISKNYGSAVVATPRYPDVTDDYPFDVVRYTSFDTTKLVGYRTGFPFSQDAMEKLHAFQPDIIHSHCPMASTFLARELRDITEAPLVFTYHTKFDIDIKRALKLKFIQEPAIREIILNIEACDDVWVVNEGAGENLKSLGFRGEYTVMPNGVDISRDYVGDEAINALNDEYNFEPSVPLFLFVGRIMWYKGIGIILETLKNLKAEGKKFRMVFVGSGDDDEKLVNTVKEYGLEEDCVITGAVYDRERLKTFYSRADLFFLPSVFDNNPLVVKEAAACSTASVLVRDSSSAEGVIDGKNGILIEDNSDSMTAALREVIDNPEKMKELGENAANDLYYSWDDSVKNAVSRYEYILSEHKNGNINRQKIKYDSAIKLLGDGFRGLMKAKLLSENIKTDISDQLNEAEKNIDGVGEWVRKKYEEIKDKFDRYQ